MGLCLDAVRKLTVVERMAEKDFKLLPSIEKVIGPLRSDAFASPSSPLGLQYVFILAWPMNNQV